MKPNIKAYKRNKELEAIIDEMADAMRRADLVTVSYVGHPTLAMESALDSFFALAKRVANEEA